MNEEGIRRALVRLGDEAAAMVGETEVEDVVASLRAQPARNRSGRWLTPIASVAVGAMALLFIVVLRPGQGPGLSLSLSDPPGETGATGTAGGPNEDGWTILDDGPLSARSGASLTWTGTEVVVLGGEHHSDGAAFNPAKRSWRPIAQSPLPPGVPQTVWTGNLLLAVGGSAGSRSAAAYDPVGDNWREVAVPPALRFSHLGGVGRPSFHWADSEAVLVDSWAAYDPASGRWRELPAPPEGFGPVGEAQAVAVWGRDLWLIGPRAVVRLDLGTGASAQFPAPRNGARDQFADGAVVGDDLYFAGESGVVSRLENGRWTTEHLAPGGAMCVPEIVELAGQPVVRTCAGIVSRGSGGWEQISSDSACCYRTLVSSGRELFLWDSNDDVRNDPSAPRKSFRSWRPS